MNKRNILSIIGAVLIIIIITILLMVLNNNNNNNINIVGEYKLSKVVLKDKEVDYGSLNFYYIFKDDNSGSIIFEDVKTNFTYEIKEEDNNIVLNMTRDENKNVSYIIKKEEEYIVIFNDIIGSLYLVKEDVPSSLKK